MYERKSDDINEVLLWSTVNKEGLYIVDDTKGVFNNFIIFITKVSRKKVKETARSLLEL